MARFALQPEDRSCASLPLPLHVVARLALVRMQVVEAAGKAGTRQGSLEAPRPRLAPPRTASARVHVHLP